MLPQTFLQPKMILSSHISWPLRMQTPCLISSLFPTFLICSSSKTDWRCVPGGYSTLGLDVDLKLSIYNWRPEGFIDFKVLNIGDTSEWSVHWIQPCRSTEKGLWKTTLILYWRSDYIVQYCTYWQSDPFGHCTLCHVHSALCTHHITRWKTLLLGCS